MATAEPMLPPGFDDDDSIDDLIAQDYDMMEEEDDEEAMMAAAFAEEDPTPTQPVVPLPFQQDEDDDDDDEDEEEGLNIRDEVQARKRPKQSSPRAVAAAMDPFSFERYKGTSSWRVQTTTTTTNRRRHVTIRPVSRKQDTASRLVERRLSFPTHVRCRNGPVDSCFLTCRNGHRLYVGERRPQGGQEASLDDSSSLMLLGEPMSVLLNRSRRRQAAQLQSPPAANSQAPKLQGPVDPTSMAHLLTDERTNRNVLRTVQLWNGYCFGDRKAERPDPAERIVLLVGPTGTGKTTLAVRVAKHAGYRPIMVDAVQGKDHWTRLQTNSILAKGQPNLLVLDDDLLDAKGSRQGGFLASLKAVVESSKPLQRRPIIVTTTRPVYEWRPILDYCRIFYVSPPPVPRLVTRLTHLLGDTAVDASWLRRMVQQQGADIRSCLYTLQMALMTTTTTNNRLDASRKDSTSTLAQVLQTVFTHPPKQQWGKSFHRTNSNEGHPTTRILETMENFGDDQRLLDAIFLNVSRVPFIDPTLDRVAGIHEWLSAGAMNHRLANVAAAASHVLCRVENVRDLESTTSALRAVRHRRQLSERTVQDFCRGHRGCSLESATTWTIPYVLSIVSNGAALSRPVTSVGLLNPDEKNAFDQHVDRLVSLGMTYRYSSNEDSTGFELDLPLHELSGGMKVKDDTNTKKDIPDAIKELAAQEIVQRRIISRQALHEQQESTKRNDKATSCITDRHKVPVGISVRVSVDTSTKQKNAAPQPLKAAASILPKTTIVNTTNKNKKRKAPSSVPRGMDFLTVGARKAKQARAAHTAARIGVLRHNHGRKKISHSGSGVALDCVVRVKYVKGFTQAVKTPCRMSDLL